VDKINLLSKLVNPENFDNSVKNRFLEVACTICTIKLRDIKARKPVSDRQAAVKEKSSVNSLKHINSLENKIFTEISHTPLNS
jgi:hypothetical protein